MVLVALFVSAFIFTGCQQAPTRVVETSQREFEILVDKTSRPIHLDGRATVLDVRPAFDYGLSRIAGSLHFPWDNLAENAKTGELLRDRRRAELRLALQGLEPSKPVLIVGQGVRGQGEDGRLAWNLVYLGFRDVQVASIDLFRAALTREAAPAPANAPIWKSTPKTELALDLAAFRQLKKETQNLRDQRIFIIDVRSPAEFATSSLKPPALNIEWRQFYTTQGRPNPEMRARLKELGLSSQDRIVVVSQRGVRSAAAAYALMALGFERVQNLTSGLQSL